MKETSLRLKPEADGSYAGSGSNLAFDGRWGVTVLVDRDGQAVEVPLELDLPIPEQRISPLRLPGKPPRYTMQVENDGFIQISPQPEEEGPEPAPGHPHDRVREPGAHRAPGGDLRRRR